MDSKEFLLGLLQEHCGEAYRIAINLHAGDPRTDGLVNSACYFLNHAMECIKEANAAYKEVEHDAA